MTLKNTAIIYFINSLKYKFYFRAFEIFYICFVGTINVKCALKKKSQSKKPRKNGNVKRI